MPRGGRAAPPAAGAGMATRDTLNYALGNLGGRQKSWMTPGQPPAAASQPPSDAPRKRGRPRKYPDEYPEQRQVPAGDGAREQPASNSTSPQLANILSHPPSGHPLPSPATILPSPSPSEDANADHRAPAAATPGPGRGRQGASSGVGTAAATARGHHVRNPSPESERPPTAARKRPAEVASPTLANKRIRPSVAAQGRRIPQPLRTSSVNIDYHDLGRRVSGGLPQSASPTASRSFSPALRQSNNSQSPLHSPYQTPLPQHATPQRVPGQTRVQNQNGPTPAVQSPLGLPRQAPPANQGPYANNAAAQGVPLFPMHLQAQMIRDMSNFSSLNGFHPLSSDYDRLTALQLAANKLDWDYLITHLFYCLLTFNKAALPEMIRNSKHTARTERFLSEVLGDNLRLTPATQGFLVRFPVPLQQWAKLNPPQYRIDVDNFVKLMDQSDNYFALRNQCDERGLPPSMHEMVYDLGIRSKQLQSILFTAALKRLWFKQGLPAGDTLNQYEQEALRYFSTIQETFYIRLQQVYDGHRERDIEMQSWIDVFRGLRASYVPAARHALQSMQASHQALVLPSQRSSSAVMRPQQPIRMSSGHSLQPSPVQQLVYPDPRLPPNSAQAAIQHGRGRPRGRPRLVTQQPRPQPQIQLQPQPVTRRHPILPPPGHSEPQQHQPNPARFGLHLAHLRSPNLRSKTGERLYLYAQSFLGVPRRLADARDKVERWSFTLSPEQIARIPRTIADTASPPVRVVDENTLMLRLRCVKWTNGQDFSEHRWATSDTSWIPYSFFELNKQPLEQRKKLHHGKDLPIDLTSLVREGENVLEIALVRGPENAHFRNYLLAIEILGIKPHAALLEDILTNNRVSAASTKQRIKDKLVGPTNDDDDEIAIVNSTLNITLFDPFSASEMCNIPVRSKACDHFDCFDLETFLKTRKRNADSTVPDNWKCPICNGDARPHHLIVDGFMQEVRSELEKQGLLKTRAIIISEDGSWIPKPEVMEGVADHDEDDAPANPNGQKPTGRQKTSTPQTREVIDLGDSDDD